MLRVRIQIAFASVLLYELIPSMIFQKSQFALYLFTIITGLLFLMVLFAIEKALTWKDERPGPDLLPVSSITIKKSTYLALRLLLLFMVVNFMNFKVDPNGEGYVTIFLVLAVMAIVFVEEYVFRFSIQRNLIRRGLSQSKVILISSGLFALSHSVLYIFLQNDIWRLANQFIFDYFLGILLGCLFFMTKSLVFVTLYHFPGAVGRLRVGEPSWEYSMTGQTIEHSLVGVLWFMLYISPLIIVSLYYLYKITRRKEVSNNHILQS